MRRGTTPTHIFETDLDLRDASIVLKSPDGTKWKLQVANDGTVSTTAI